MELFFAKIAVSILAVLALSAVAERVSPRAGGIMAGYPLGTAIALFFIGIENGIDFATQAALYTLPGFVAAMALAGGYFLGLRSGLKPPALIATLLSCLCFAITSYILRMPEYTLIGALLVPVIAIPIFAFFFRKIENVRVNKPVTITLKIILIRGATAASIVLVITGLASLIGPSWSGLLAAFPVTMVPFLILLHLTYGEGQALTVIKNYPAGLGALVVYTITVYLSYGSLGIAFGTLLSFGTATSYLLVYSSFLKFRERNIASV